MPRTAPHRASRAAPRALAGLIAAAGLALAAGFTGCTVSYETYPSDGAPALQNPNIGAIRPVSAAAVRAVAGEGPRGSDGSFAVNLPARMTTKNRQAIADLIGPQAEPVSRENVRAIPVYHVGRVWVRGAEATVDVLVPRETGVDPAAQDRHDYDGYTVYLKGGLNPWRVDRFRRWLPGTLDVPPLAFGPEPDAAEASATSAAVDPPAASTRTPARPTERQIRAAQTPTTTPAPAYDAERERALRETFRPAPAPSPQGPPPRYEPGWTQAELPPAPVARPNNPGPAAPPPSRDDRQYRFDPPPAGSANNPWIEENVELPRPSQQTWQSIEGGPNANPPAGQTSGQAAGQPATTEPAGAVEVGRSQVPPQPQTQPGSGTGAQQNLPPAPGADRLPPPPAPRSDQSNLPPRYVPSEG